MSFHVPELPFADAAPVFTLLFLAIISAPLVARRLRIPEVVVLVFAGFLIGPTGLGLVERAGPVELLGGLGLLYLMFLAGVELDLDEFRAHRADAALFGTLTFLLPMVIVASVATALGYGPAAAILLASCFASHTLIAYPAFQRLGTFANRAVVTAVGGTILTDTAALLVLAVVANSTRGELGIAFWATLIPSMGVIVFLALVTLPRLSRRFFSGAGQDGTLRFLWVLVATFLVASLVETAGVEAIIGAFLAGIALSRTIPAGGLLMERIEFVGASIFVPLFLISVGMLVDLSVLADPRTLGIGLAFTAATIVAKYAAAWLTGRIRSFSRTEVAALFSMSVAQAAATLAAVIVGFDVGLLDEPTVNAVILVILLTCVLASVVAARVAPSLPRPERQRPLGSRVVVAIGNPASAARLLRSGSLFAVADSGVVVPLLIAPPEVSDEELDRIRELEAEAVALAQSRGAEARGQIRIDAPPDAGIRSTVMEQRASLLVLGWTGASTTRGPGPLGPIVERVLRTTALPTLVAYDGGAEVERVVVGLPPNASAPAALPALQLALRAAALGAATLSTPVEVLQLGDDPAADALVRERLGVAVRHLDVDVEEAIRQEVRPTDVCIVPAMATTSFLRNGAARIARTMPAEATVVLAFDTGATASGQVVGASTVLVSPEST